MMALVPAPVCTTPVSSLILLPQTRARSGRSFACHRSPSPPPSSSPHSQGDSTSAEPPHSLASSAPLLESKTAHSAPAFTYKLSADRTADSVVRLDPSAESAVERGCVYIVDAYRVYWTSCIRGLHTGQMVLRLVEAIDVYLAGTVMLIFGMGLYGLFISNVNPEVPSTVDRALKGSSLFGMFALKERPKWMQISSLDELKTKVGHVIVMILLVKMFERSKMVTIATGMDLLSYAVCIFLSSASLYILHNLHKSE
ncbi:uncharacterized protein LOC109724156 isoform X3 [Ananas comosus]|uniref:Uncharacterized protein LOC109724156 isoform X3 n=1 Tax=Ananas comosus TaxID=4615 RepID=A0A6P5GIJ4_ANACO|nr:uncharacterized protein LOC109724156 isoform X3 [Ananas comosus]